jgi:hypothetical protein
MQLNGHAIERGRRQHAERVSPSLTSTSMRALEHLREPGLDAAACLGAAELVGDADVSGGVIDARMH